MALNMAKAKKNNAIYASKTKPPWKDRFYQVAEQVGIYNQTPTPETFAQAVYQWQTVQPGMTADGILGPKSWAKLEPKTRYSIDYGAPPDWISEMPPGWKPDVPDAPEENGAPQNNGITDRLEERAKVDPSFQTTLTNSGVFLASWRMGDLLKLAKVKGNVALKGNILGGFVQPIVWAMQGNTGDWGDKFLYVAGLYPPLTIAAGAVGIWKGIVDDIMLAKLAQVRADEPSYVSKAIFPVATYGAPYTDLNAQKIAGEGGVAWQHPNGLWVYVKLEKNGKPVYSCDYKPRNAVKILGPELPLNFVGRGWLGEWLGGGLFTYRSYKGGY